MARMGDNLAATAGVIMSERVVLALEPCLGRPEATRLVQEAAGRTAASGRSLGEELAHDPGVARALSWPTGRNTIHTIRPVLQGVRRPSLQPRRVREFVKGCMGGL